MKKLVVETVTFGNRSLTDTAPETKWPLPGYATAGAAGMDLIAVNSSKLEPGQYALFPCGISIAVPPGYEAQVRPRSGMAVSHGITVLNAPGTIDSDYRGEVCVVLINLGVEPFDVIRGMRIAQLVFAPVVRVTLYEVNELPPTKRDTGGFGSTGA